MLQADYRNGLRRDPAPPLPAYSWDNFHSVTFDPTTAAGASNLGRWADWEKSYTAEESSRGSFERLLNLDAAAEYELMMQDARCKVDRAQHNNTPSNLSPKFHVYPVGVALIPGNFTVEWSSSNYLNGGSNLNYFSDHHKNAPIRKFHVNVQLPPLLSRRTLSQHFKTPLLSIPHQTVPFVHWIISNFRPADYGSRLPFNSIFF
jgi:hypothetical protein